jgi:hypothetical protein
MITLSAPVRHEGGWMSTRPERPLHGPLQRFDLETPQVACDGGVRRSVEALSDAVCLISLARSG